MVTNGLITNLNKVSKMIILSDIL